VKYCFYSSRSALGIGAASFASFNWNREAGTGAGLGNGIWVRGEISEQRYSGKPDGAAGTPKK